MELVEGKYLSWVKVLKKQEKNRKGLGSVERGSWKGVLELWGAGMLELVSTVERALEFRIFGYQIFFKKKRIMGGGVAVLPRQQCHPAMVGPTQPAGKRTHPVGAMVVTVLFIYLFIIYLFI